MKLLKALMEKESATLKALHKKGEEDDAKMQAKGYRGVGDKTVAKAFAPNDEYPAPWSSKESKEGINTIRADNGKIVANWMNRREAEAVLAEIGQGVTEQVIYSNNDKDMTDPEVLVHGVGRYQLSQVKANVERKIADMAGQAKKDDSPEKWEKLAWMLDHAAMKEMVKTIVAAHGEIADHEDESKH